MIELGVVLSVMLVIAALATPSIVNTMADFKLRSAASELSGMMQRARFTAVQKNTFYVVRQYVDSDGVSWIYVDTNNNSAKDDGEPAMPMPQNVTHVTADYPSGLDAAKLGFSADPQPATALPRFSARGLPCVVSGNVCVTFDASGKPVGFVYYLQQTRALGDAAYVALAISPGGRMRTWTYSGSSWQ